MLTLFKVSSSLILYWKAKRSVSVLKEQAKAAANLVKARAGSAAGSHRAKTGKNMDGSNKGAKDSKEVAKKVSKILAVRGDSFLLGSLINRISRGLENQIKHIL